MSAANQDRFLSLLEQAGELTRLLLKSPQPPRTLTAEYLHGRKRASRDEKALISTLAHHALLRWRYAAFCVHGNRTEVDARHDSGYAPAVVPAVLLLLQHDSIARLSEGSVLHELAQSGYAAETVHACCERVLQNTVSVSLQQLLGRSELLEKDATTDLQAAAVRFSVPDWVSETWRDIDTNLLPADLASLGEALSHPAPLMLRSNTLINTREQLLDRLAQEEITATAHPILPEAIQILRRLPLTESILYDEGRFEVQDAGSQLIGYACGAQPGMQVFDACAGAGGKTMHVVNNMRDHGMVIAGDIEKNKLRSLRQRSARLNLQSVRTVALSPDGSAQSEGDVLPSSESQDLVLVDAPCSGFGTVRRNPALKWKLTPRTVSRLSQRQLAILGHNASYVRPGGILLYATCSLLPEENVHVVRQFLSTHPDFEEDELEPTFLSQGLCLPDLDPSHHCLTLHPAVLDSDGYFMARMKRRSS